jgi:hypothetical protein
MVQQLLGFGFKGSGIVGIFLIVGIILVSINNNVGILFLNTGYGIGLILGLLGIFGIAKKVGLF